MINLLDIILTGYQPDHIPRLSIYDTVLSINALIYRLFTATPNVTELIAIVSRQF